MPLDPSKIALAVAGGLSVVCSTCSKYWRARDLGIPGDTCLAQDGCGSPIAGDVFHEYDGPMTQFDRFCFVCGNRSTHAIRVDDQARVIGCCADHVEMVQRLKPSGQTAPRMVLISKEGETVVDEDTQPKQVLRFRSDG